MYRAGMTRAELRAFHAALRSSHSLRVRIYVLNMDHEHVADLSERFEDGQVNIDADADVTRSATISFLDQGRTFDFDSDSPSDGALFANRMLRIVYRVKVDAISEWVETPVFTGPVTKVDRSGDVVNVEAQGKESLAMGAAWEPMTVKKGVSKVDAIRRIMRERGGEDRFDFPDLPSRLPKAVSLGRSTAPWTTVQKIAKSLDRKLFYNGAGVLCLRHHSGNEVFTFSDGSNGEVVSEPQVSFTIEDVANAVWVKGGKPKAQKRKNETREEFDTRQDKERGIRYDVHADHANHLSPFYGRGLGRPNAPRYLLEEIENDHVRSEKEARQLGNRTLKDRMEQSEDVTCDSLVIPHLEEGDRVRLRTSVVGHAFALRQFSIPLKHDGVMSIGYHKRVSMSTRRPHKRHPKKKPGRDKGGRKGGKKP